MYYCNSPVFDFVRLFRARLGNQPPKRARSKWNFFVADNPHIPKSGLKTVFDSLEREEIEKLQKRVDEDKLRVKNEIAEFEEIYGHKPIQTSSDKSEAVIDLCNQIGKAFVEATRDLAINGKTLRDRRPDYHLQAAVEYFGPNLKIFVANQNLQASPEDVCDAIENWTKCVVFRFKSTKTPDLGDVLRFATIIRETSWLHSQI